MAPPKPRKEEEVPRFWYPHSSEGYVLGEVLHESGGDQHVKLLLPDGPKVCVACLVGVTTCARGVWQSPDGRAHGLRRYPPCQLVTLSPSTSAVAGSSQRAGTGMSCRS